MSEPLRPAIYMGPTGLLHYPFGGLPPICPKCETERSVWLCEYVARSPDYATADPYGHHQHIPTVADPHLKFRCPCGHVLTSLCADHDFSRTPV